MAFSFNRKKPSGFSRVRDDGWLSPVALFQSMRTTSIFQGVIRKAWTSPFSGATFHLCRRFFHQLPMEEFIFYQDIANIICLSNRKVKRNIWGFLEVIYFILS